MDPWAPLQPALRGYAGLASVLLARSLFLLLLRMMMKKHQKMRKKKRNNRPNVKQAQQAAFGGPMRGYSMDLTNALLTQARSPVLINFLKTL